MEQFDGNISVIVCCYNSEFRLPITLGYLARQKLKPNVNWEIIVVDNNSTDNTSLVAKKEWEKLGAPTELLVAEERQAGLTYAREKGIATAQYKTLVFCDDDNWLAPNYLQLALEIMAEHPEVGALGGKGAGVFEKDEPAWFEKNKRFFAAAEQAKASGDITAFPGFLFGAGMIVRKSAIDQLRQSGFRSVLTDREGENLSSGGDSELCVALKMLGYKLWYDERLTYLHFMPASRMTLVYLERLRKSMVKSNVILTFYRNEHALAKHAGIRIFLSLLNAVIKKFGHHSKNVLLGNEFEKLESRVYFILLKLLVLDFRQLNQTNKSVQKWIRSLPQASTGH